MKILKNNSRKNRIIKELRRINKGQGRELFCYYFRDRRYEKKHQEQVKDLENKVIAAERLFMDQEDYKDKYINLLASFETLTKK